MLSILPIPPLHLSITARGFVRVAIAQPLSALLSSAAQALVGAHRASLPPRVFTLYGQRSVARAWPCSRFPLSSLRSLGPVGAVCAALRGLAAVPLRRSQYQSVFPLLR
jgi:hypothetical protein